SVDDGLGRRLWSSDGTPDGTGYATADDNIFMQTDYLTVNVKNPFPVINNVLYFAGTTFADGGGLYKFNAFNNAGISLVTDLTPAPDIDFITPVDFAIVGNRLYFKVINSIGGYHDELWKSDGTAASSKLIKTFVPGEITFDHNNGNGLLYFNKTDLVLGNELWKSDGTQNGTVMVKDIWEGNVSAAPYYLTECNGKLLFNAADKDNGASLYATDGTSAGTKLVKEINTSSTSSSNAGGFNTSDMAVSKNGALFSAFERGHGYELYQSNAKNGGTELVKDIIDGEGSSYPNAFISKNGLTYFRANNTDQSAGFPGSTIYKTDGSKNGTKKIVDVNNAYFMGYDVADNGLVYYLTFDLVTFTYDLWRTDGSIPGTYLLNATLYFSPYVVTSGNTAYFVAGDESNGFELWKSNGTVASTKMVKDIFQGPDGSYPYSLFVFDKNIYFGAYDGISFTYSFWKSDGTANGTLKLKDITPASGFGSDGISRLFCVSNHTLYFNAVDYNALVYQGAELWKTNGSPNGTKLVKDINVNADSNPYNLTDVNGALFFTAYDDINGNELWSSYGTAASTRIVKDITPGFEGSFISNLVSSRDKLYFLKDNLLWLSDGGDHGTHPVEDGGLDRLTFLQNLMGSNDNLFFSAYSYKYGTELYTNANDGDHKKNNENNVTALKVTPENATTGSMTAMIFPNPATNILNVNIASPNMEVTRLTVSGADGKVFISQDVNGKRVARIDVSHLQTGIYFVKLVGGTSGDHVVQKFIKE
ncbi:MAG TPA: T9SS type A sorting domain-containing protein, partial [Chitinophagaceae bacterium]|nr:T9SS type A sorting domain-containing protein [Chitinophagaceae bacterium]